MLARGPLPSDALAECLHQRLAHTHSLACPRHLLSLGLHPCRKQLSHLENKFQ